MSVARVQLVREFSYRRGVEGEHSDLSHRCVPLGIVVHRMESPAS
jgi:hypothetical protein